MMVKPIKFYTEKLGFKVVTDQPFDSDLRWIEPRIPRRRNRMVLFTADEHRDRIGTSQPVSFMAGDVEQEYRELSGRGVSFDAPPRRKWSGEPFTSFRDPDGNKFVPASK